MSPLLIALITAGLPTSDLLASYILCPSLEKHIHMMFIAAFSYGTSHPQQSSAACTQGSTGKDNHHLGIAAFIYSHPSVQISFGNTTQ